jgi:hypothetical protein
MNVERIWSVLVRFDIRPDPEGWTIYDRKTGEPAIIEGFVPAGLPHHEADDLVDLLNTLDILKRQTTLH